MDPQLLTWVVALLFLLGIIALVVEMFILPGFGLAGVFGIILIGWAIFLMAVDVTQATMALVWALVATVVFFFVSIKIFTKLNLWQKLTLTTKQNKGEGYVAPRPDLSIYIGKKGVSLTPLRPSGAVEISGQRLDVVTGGDFIPAGRTVEVVSVEGTRVIVRAADITDKMGIRN
ncbi:MAG: NfeD family protein [Bacillota bacterium]